VVPFEKALVGFGIASRAWMARQPGRKRETHMNLNQLTIFGLIGQNAETKRANGTAVSVPYLLRLFGAGVSQSSFGESPT